MFRRFDQAVLRCRHRVLPKSVSFSVEPETAEANLFGKTVGELQSDIVIDETSISGTLHYVTGYTGFSSVSEEQSGNYLALKVDAPEEAIIVVDLIGGTKGAVELDSDRNIVLKIANKDAQSIEITMEQGDDIVEKTYTLSDLTLESEE